MDGECFFGPGEVEHGAVVVVLDEADRPVRTLRCGHHHGLRGGLGIHTLHEKDAVDDLITDRCTGVQEQWALCVREAGDEYDGDNDGFGCFFGKHVLFIVQQRHEHREHLQHDEVVMVVDRVHDRLREGLQTATGAAIEKNEQIDGEEFHVERATVQLAQEDADDLGEEQLVPEEGVELIHVFDARTCDLCSHTTHHPTAGMSSSAHIAKDNSSFTLFRSRCMSSRYPLSTLISSSFLSRLR